MHSRAVRTKYFTTIAIYLQIFELTFANLPFDSAHAVYKGRTLI